MRGMKFAAEENFMILGNGSVCGLNLMVKVW